MTSGIKHKSVHIHYSRTAVLLWTLILGFKSHRLLLDLPTKCKELKMITGLTLWKICFCILEIQISQKEKNLQKYFIVYSSRAKYTL
jgi:hypothetical protein